MATPYIPALQVPQQSEELKIALGKLHVALTLTSGLPDSPIKTELEQVLTYERSRKNTLRRCHPSTNGDLGITLS